MHPLDPLTASEISAAVAILGRDRGADAGWRFGTITLLEPPKATMIAWDERTPLAREALVTLWNRADGAAYEAVVDIGGDRVTRFDHRPGVQPNFTTDEYHEVDALLRAHPDVVAALAKRGIDDPSLVLFDTWAYGEALVPERYRSRRVGWTDAWVRTTPDTNPYAHLVSGFHCVVDTNSMELLEIDDSGAVPQPNVMGEYAPRHIPDLRVRDDLKPLEITQPEGASFTLDGRLLRWQRWTMRIGFTPREGLVLHRVGYEQDGETRPIAHRMSFAEMVVPYRDPTPDHYRRTAFDIGEWGMGFMTTSLALGCDCLGEITYVDEVVHDSHGNPISIPQAICIHEEDNAILWKHVDPITGTEARRMRRLVVSFHVTVANYEYLVYWRFHEDGNIECEVRATGLMVTTGFAGDAPPYGTVVDERTYAPFHQHFIVARLDLDVDGAENTVYEVDSAATPMGPDNPSGLAVTTVATPVTHEAEGARDYDWNTQRGWKVANPGRLNAHGSPVAYKLVPTASVPPLLGPETPVRRRANVIGHQLWVTAHDDHQRFPCGDYPTQSLEDTGLPVWMAANRPLENADVVLWYVFGIHHITRVEDWPVMPVDTVSFWLKPFGFFDRNPALDVAPTPHCHS
jgi:primary-amine oxidase